MDYRRGQRRVLHRAQQDRQELVYVYFENEPGRRPAANPLTRDKVRRIGANIAKLPELVQQASALQITIVHRRRPGSTYFLKAVKIAQTAFASWRSLK
jgi:hypothetical protein